MLLHILTGILASISNDFLLTIISSVTTLVTGYIILRERLVKTELKLNNLHDYINSRNELLETKMSGLREDLIEFKEINKDFTIRLNETTKTLNDSMGSIRELKILLKSVSNKIADK